MIPDYFPNVELYAIVENNLYAGFIGLSLDTIEMLFIDSDRRGQGYGSALVEFARQRGATKVDVNEQNPSALNFYRAKRFRVMAKDETDDAGRPYPILHLSLYNGTDQSRNGESVIIRQRRKAAYHSLDPWTAETSGK